MSLNPGGPDPRHWDPSRYDQEVLHHVDRAHDRLEREINLRFGSHNFWCQPNVRGYNQVRLYVPNIDGDRVIPDRRSAEEALDYAEGHMERNDPDFALNFTTGNGNMAAVLQVWDMRRAPLNEVLGNSSFVGLLKVLYYWRGTQPVHSMTHAMLDE